MRGTHHFIKTCTPFSFFFQKFSYINNDSIYKFATRLCSVLSRLKIEDKKFARVNL